MSITPKKLEEIAVAPLRTENDKQVVVERSAEDMKQAIKLSRSLGAKSFGFSKVQFRKVQFGEIHPRQ